MPQRPAGKIERYLLWLVLFLGLWASGLYFLQGGFAMGHNPLDLHIVVLLLPGFIVGMLFGLLLVMAGVPESALSHIEYIFLVAIPVVCNVMCVKAICALVAAAKAKR